MESATNIRAKISAFIVCCNEESKIKAALDSVIWCDEIVVVDSGSTDRTVEICKTYTSNVIYNKWPGYLEQKQFALEHCAHDWVINIDADEVVSEDLKENILQMLTLPAKKRDKVAGYEINRVVNFLGRWWRRGGWYPEYRLRLFQRSAAKWGGTNPHEKAIVAGRIKKIKGEIYHFTYDDFSNQVDTINKFSSFAAIEQYNSGERSSLIKILVNPLARFLKFYFLKRGFLEGLAGLIVAINETYYVFLKYSKLWALERYSYEKPLETLSNITSPTNKTAEFAKK